MQLVRLSMKSIYSIRINKLRMLLKINLKREKLTKKEKMKKFMKRRGKRFRNNTMIN